MAIIWIIILVPSYSPFYPVFKYVAGRAICTELQSYTQAVPD